MLKARTYYTLLYYYSGSFSRFRIQDEHNASCSIMFAAQCAAKEQGKNTKSFKSENETWIIFQFKAVLSPESQILSHPAQNPTDRTCDNKQAD